MSSRPALAAVALAVVLAAPAGPAPSAAPAFSHTVFSDIRLSGDIVAGGLDGAYLPAPCWLEPRFTGAQSYAAGDPRIPYSPRVDADTYWWWFASQQPGLMYLLGRGSGSRSQVNASFRRNQGKAGWWWAPAWANSGQGFACAQGLIDTLNLNAAYLDFLPPSTGGGDAPGHTVDGRILADLARAALSLPAITVHTSPPAPSAPSDVNLPTFAWATYDGPMRPHATASVPLPGGGTLSATVATSRPTLTLSVAGPAGAGQAQVRDHCGATGTPYPRGGRGAAVPSCGVTFLAPSTTGPYTLTATARWTVTWSDSTGRSGGFPSPPYPPATATSSVSVSVREIQAVNGG